MANRDSDQMLRSPVSDYSLHCLFRLVYSILMSKYGNMLGKIFKGQQSELFFLFLPQNESCHFMQIVLGGRGGGGGAGVSQGRLGRLVSVNNPNVIRLFTYIWT